MDYVERNYEILEQKMIESMENALEFGRELIDSELDAGFFNALVKPVLKTFYDYWCDKDARTGTKKQIKVTLDIAKKMVENGSDEKFENLIEDNFQEYLSGDQTYIYCSKNHKNFERLKKITKKCFVSQVKDAVRFLKVQDNVSSYNELTRTVFETKDEAYDSLSRQLDFNDEGIRIVEEDPSILTVPTGKKIILKILRKGFEETKRELINRLDEIYC
ncbi:MAG: hypothetical protein BAJALOKI3v1_90066 [Promethearchaeota archaeon]|jgi:hypothetical protein|nr:MAG: hypothetical protein BAJALOKI3v1_90066 [Candidatus Lokiarchaeota archaeon]